MALSDMKVKLEFKWWYSLLLTLANLTRNDEFTCWVFDKFFSKGILIKEVSK